MRTTKAAVKFAKYYCRMHGIKFRSSKSMEISGQADLIEDMVIIRRDKNLIKFLSYLFHEVAHVRCAREKIFPLYHSRNRFYKNDSEIAKIRQQAWRAEVKVDKMAREEMKAYFPHLKYDAWYIRAPKEAKEFIKEYYQ